MTTRLEQNFLAAFHQATNPNEDPRSDGNRDIHDHMTCILSVHVIACPFHQATNPNEDHRIDCLRDIHDHMTCILSVHTIACSVHHFVRYYPNENSVWFSL